MRTQRRRWIGLVVMLLVGVSGPTPPAGADANQARGAPATYRSLSLGFYSSCGILDNGTVKCWGRNNFGQLGQGDTNDRGDTPGELGDVLAPIALGTGRTASAISAGSFHTCAVLDDGTVKCWGNGSFGRLGYGDTANRGGAPGQMGNGLPTVALGTGRKAVAVSAGDTHTCALLDNGTVKCWGGGISGQLGYGDTNHRGDDPGEMGDNLPAVALGRSAVAITAGAGFTCAILDNGTVKCWGYNGNGQLGLGVFDSKGDNPGEMGDSLPAVALGTGRTAVAISASRGAHVCALLDNGSVKCWGDNSWGQLGQGDFDTRGWEPADMGDNLPAISLGTGRTATAIAVGDYSSCARLDDGTVKCWGNNDHGELGQGDTVSRGDGPGEMGDNLAALSVGAGRTVTTIVRGDYHSCAILDNGSLKCWGDGFWGNLGLGDKANWGEVPSDMGDGLPTVDVGTGRTVGLATRVGVSISAPAPVVAGGTLSYDITVTNTGGVRLTGVQAVSDGVPDCERPVADLAPGDQATWSCEHVTTQDDVPQMVNVVLITTDQGAYRLGVRRTRVDAVVHRPDALVRLGSGAFVGNGVYNTTGASQTRSTTVPNLGSATFTVRLQNDGNLPDDLEVLGQGTTSRYTVTYKDGATNVTTQVVAGTYTLAALAPGASHDLTVTIKARAGTPVNNIVNRLVTVTSATDSSKKDAVKASVKRR